MPFLNDTKPYVKWSDRKKMESAGVLSPPNTLRIPKKVPAGQTVSTWRLLPIKCAGCGETFKPKSRAQRFCSRNCIAANPEMRAIFSDQRRQQLAVEEAVAEKLRQKGWEIYSPTVVCDRIGVFGGRVYFIEFKPKHNQELRPGQKRIHDLVPSRYKVVTH